MCAPLRKVSCVCMGWALQIHGVRHSLQTGRLHPKKTHAMGRKLARGCISSAQRKRGVTAGQSEAKVHLKSPLLWGTVGKYPTGCPEDTHCWPTSTCQSRPLNEHLSGSGLILKAPNLRRIVHFCKENHLFNLLMLLLPPLCSLTSLLLSSHHGKTSDGGKKRGGGGGWKGLASLHRAYLILLSVPIPPTSFSLSRFIYTTLFFHPYSFLVFVALTLAAKLLHA